MKKNNKSRSCSGQSLVEYAIGIGCVAAVCMIALASTGHISGHIVHAIEEAFIYGGEKSTHPQEIANLSAQPWILQ